MEIFYHGSSALFREFCLSHALEGDGKMKFGFGLYVTQSYRTAAHYASTGKGASAEDHYVYTVEVPESREDNHLWSNRPVHPAIVRRAETRLKEQTPEDKIISGVEYYQAVLEDNVTTLDELYNWVDTHRANPKGEYWMPD